MMVAAIASIGASIFGAIGAMQQAQSQAAMANYQSQVAQMNKMIADQNARFEQMRGEQQAQHEGLKAKAQLGSVVAGLGASGLDIGSGSAQDVQDATFRLGKYNEDIVRNDAARRAYDFQTQSVQYEAQSRLFQFEGEQYKKAGTISAIGSLLGGVGQVAGKWYQYGGAPNVLGG